MPSPVCKFCGGSGLFIDLMKDTPQACPRCITMRPTDVGLPLVYTFKVGPRQIALLTQSFRRNDGEIENILRDAHYEIWPDCSAKDLLIIVGLIKKIARVKSGEHHFWSINREEAGKKFLSWEMEDLVRVELGMHPLYLPKVAVPEGLF